MVGTTRERACEAGSDASRIPLHDRAGYRDGVHLRTLLPTVRRARTSSDASGLRGRLAVLLRSADVEIDGSRPWDPRINDERVFDRILADGTLAVGETYMDGWWDCDRLDDLVCRVLTVNVDRALRTWKDSLALVAAKVWNAGRRSRAFEIGERHYDLGNALFDVMLDRRMTYSCAYWSGASDLDAAQEAKLDLVCRKVGLRPGMRVLDIGCGWGSFAIFAAERYGVHVVGVTVSGAQQRLATQRGRGLPVEFRLQDYRDVAERFDAIVSIGMFEHVGAKNYAAYFDVARRCLADRGVFLLHTIGSRTESAAGDRWMSRYIFPRSHIPSAAEIARAIGPSFVLEDWHNFGADYDRTLLAWENRFAAGWSDLAARYDERFRRMWRYYLLSCAGAFRARQLQLWQLVLSKGGVMGGYRSIR